MRSVSTARNPISYSISTIGGRSKCQCHAVAGGAAPYQFIAQGKGYVVVWCRAVHGLCCSACEGSHAPFISPSTQARFAAQTLG